MILFAIQGIPNPIKTSKMLLPRVFETAMSPCPFLAEYSDPMKSGKLVPIASTVNPKILLRIVLKCKGILTYQSQLA